VLFRSHGFAVAGCAAGAPVSGKIKISLDIEAGRS
jgi:hypothetical protein